MGIKLLSIINTRIYKKRKELDEVESKLFDVL